MILENVTKNMADVFQACMITRKNESTLFHHMHSFRERTKTTRSARQNSSLAFSESFGAIIFMQKFSEKNPLKSLSILTDAIFTKLTCQEILAVDTFVFERLLSSHLIKARRFHRELFACVMNEQTESTLN